MIKVALAGVGNVAAKFVQQLYACKISGAEPKNTILPNVDKYKVSEIDIVAAFDVAKNKIGLDLSKAVLEKPNLTDGKYMQPSGITVSKGVLLDGVSKHMKEIFKPYDDRVSTVDDIAGELRSSKADMLINLIPVGSIKASEAYAHAALEAGVAFINAIPVFIASDPTGKFPRLFKKRHLPLVGDDMKGQMGATILHRTIASLFENRGASIEESYQLNIGGNTDFLNMLDQERLELKRVSKTKAVTSTIHNGDTLEKDSRIRIGPSDYVPFLKNDKIAHMYVKGRGFGGSPILLNLSLQVDDKSNAAAVLVDVIRLTKLALDRGYAGTLNDVSAFYFKHPPIQSPNDYTAYDSVIEFVNNLNPA